MDGDAGGDADEWWGGPCSLTDQTREGALVDIFIADSVTVQKDLWQKVITTINCRLTHDCYQR